MLALAPVVACLALAPALAPAPAGAVASRPVVYTGEANALATTSATLNGSIDPSNQVTSYYFQYGATLAYGAQTPTLVAGEGTQSLHVSAPISGLAPGTTYHYRLVAMNAAGTTDGQDRTFTAKRVPLAFTISASPAPVLFKSALTVSGTLSGSESAGRKVVLQANPFPYLSGFTDIGASTITDAAGAFSFPVEGLTQNTQLRVATLDVPPTASSVIIEFVAVRVTFHVARTRHRGYLRLYGTVTPAEVGAQVSIQLLVHGRTPRGVGSTFARAGTPSVSRFSRVVQIKRAGLYRAMVYVASGAQVSNPSRTILIR